jgi:hypothetical protein
MLTVKDSFFWNGTLFPTGQKVDASDPVVIGRRHLFSGETPSGSFVEAATAAPGEKRSVAKKKVAASKTAKSRADID